MGKIQENDNEEKKRKKLKTQQHLQNNTAILHIDYEPSKALKTARKIAPIFTSIKQIFIKKNKYHFWTEENRLQDFFVRKNYQLTKKEWTNRK